MITCHSPVREAEAKGRCIAHHDIEANGSPALFVVLVHVLVPHLRLHHVGALERKLVLERECGRIAGHGGERLRDAHRIDDRPLGLQRGHIGRHIARRPFERLGDALLCGERVARDLAVADSHHATLDAQRLELGRAVGHVDVVRAGILGRDKEHLLASRIVIGLLGADFDGELDRILILVVVEDRECRRLGKRFARSDLDAARRGRGGEHLLL